MQCLTSTNSSNKKSPSSAIVDLVLIDTAYDGQVLDIALSDVPGQKDDLLAGHYELPAPTAPTRLAVKIIDMLREEVICTAQV